MKSVLTPRLFLFYGLFLLVFLVLAARLFELQIIYGSFFRQLSENNRIQKVVEPAPRGIIYDRQEKALVSNLPVFFLCQTNKQTCQLMSRDQALSWEAAGPETDQELKVTVGRHYLYGPALAHVLGYLGEASQAEVQKGEFQLGDLVGRTGLEEEYEKKLHGQDGGQIFEVNTLGEKVREIGRFPPLAGEDLHLTIDASLSQVAFAALEGRKGAVVATEAKTGRVLVLVASPSFNPEKISAAVLADEQQPLFNRAVAGVYPPGSVFKIVTAVAGLEAGRLDENTVYQDQGFIKIGDYVYRNWYFSQYGRTEGELNLVRALKRSTDTFFYKVGEWVGANRLADWAKAFGLGQPTGIDLPHEASGLVPDPEWKERTKGESWFLGNTYHLAIGQSDLLATPLQINMMTGVIAHQGQLCQPQLLVSNPSCRDLHLKPSTLALVKEGMKEACAAGGTAFPFFDFTPAGGRVACKTGTAEFADPQGRTHAWLTAFAPVNDPQIVVTALVEAGGEGADVAAPIVKKVLTAWFEK